MRFVILALLALSLWAHRAAACPCCNPCHKYDRLMREPPVEVMAASYTAAASLGDHPKTRDVMRVLTGATFVAGDKGVRALRVVDGAHVPQTIDHADHARIEIAHDLAVRHGHFQVTLGGSLYTIEPCTDGHHHAATCLSRSP